MSRGQRLALLGLAAVVAVAAVLLIRPREDDPGPARTGGDGSATEPPARSTGEAEPRPAEPQYQTLQLRDGRPVGGVKEITVKSGDRVRLAVRSNEPAELHIHGYDRYVDVRPRKVARASFPARLEGVFEIEEHGTGAEVASLEVVP